MGTSHRIDIVILAAGASRRLGRPKQLLPYKGSTLLRYLTEESLRSSGHHSTVIVPAEPEAVLRSVEDLPVTRLINVRPDEGLSSSIRLGIGSLPSESDGAILMLCDMPRVNTSHLNALIQKQHQTGGSIVASRYRGVTGAPVLFMRTHFGKLKGLVGDAGARDVVREHPDEVESVLLPGGEIDIDTAHDAERYLGLIL